MSESTDSLSTWGKLRKKRWFRWGGDVLIVGAVLTLMMMWSTRNHVESGKLAPALQLRALEGEPFDLAASDRPTLVFFWAPWCSVCHRAVGNIDAVRDAVGGDANVVTVALSYDSIKDVEGFVEEYDVRAPVLLGGRDESDAWHVNSFPTIYIVNAEGEVSSSIVGYTTEIGLRLRLARMGVF